MKLDWTKWNTERLKVETEICKMKAIVHRSGYTASFIEWRQLKEFKYEAWRLYCLRAELKGKLHCQKLVAYKSDIDEQGYPTGITIPVEFPMDHRIQQLHAFVDGWHHQFLLPEVSEPLTVAS